ncbi:hypothetical protein Bpfe_030010 [Biomphalaria pfeifferi]|uniref:Uncharacterized protein n=1 Tax=Biomphalaria pfeifferi TaxID=112525 RepID=A0AAD8ARD6_BIOPF|nr:hypothetical protein Bpfe_030010 [Biomphalaria pfeifferi]
MPTLSQYNILSRLRSKLVVSTALASQGDSAAADDQEAELQEQEEVSRSVSTEEEQAYSSAAEVAEVASNTSSNTIRSDTPREQRIRSSKYTSLSENCKMGSVPEVETNEAMSSETSSVSVPEEKAELDKELNSPLEVASLDSEPYVVSLQDSEKDPSGRPFKRTPTKPCLKRSDSCFIRRPESRSKSVTFERPYSVFSDLGRRSLNSSQSDFSLPYIAGTSKTIHSDIDDSDSDDNVFLTDTERTASIERKQARESIQNRPSSCGPAMQRSSPTSSESQRPESERRRSFNLNRRPSSENLPLLPRFSFGGFFSVRRGSVINRTLFSSNAINSERRDLGLEPYEVYIIRNCRLIRRDRMGHNLNSLESPKDVKKRFDFSDAKEDTDGGINESEDRMKSTENKGSPSDDAEVREPEVSGLRINHLEIHRWSNEKQAIVVERPTSASEMATNGLMVQKSTPWKEEVLQLPEEQKEELLKLGFRKPTKTKKKKSKSEKKKAETESAAPQRIEINLKEDPLLIKVSKKNKNVGHFLEKPAPQPNAVCFEILGSNQTHNEVKLQLERLLKTCPEVKIMSIKFDHRAIYNNSKEMFNRWIITTNSILGRNRLAGCDMVFDEQVVQLRRYDDVINGEFQQFTRMQNFVKMMNNRKILGKAAGEKTII